MPARRVRWARGSASTHEEGDQSERLSVIPCSVFDASESPRQFQDRKAFVSGQVNGSRKLCLVIWEQVDFL